MTRHVCTIRIYKKDSIFVSLNTKIGDIEIHNIFLCSVFTFNFLLHLTFDYKMIITFTEYTFFIDIVLCIVNLFGKQQLMKMLIWNLPFLKLLPTNFTILFFPYYKALQNTIKSFHVNCHSDELN